MHFNWNKSFSRVLASSVAALSATTSLYAIPKGPCDTKPEVCCEEPKPGPFAFSYPMDMNLTCPRDFYVHIDGLLFQAKQDGMEFAIQDSTGAATDTPITHGRVEGFSNDHTDWDYNPGMRFGIGFYLDHDAWNIDFNWTWLNITDYNHANATTSGGVVLPMWLVGDDTVGAQFNGTRSSATWDTSYNTVDARLGKPYHVSRYLILNPHFGVRAAWIDQHFSVDYGGTNGGSATRTIHHGDNDFWGIGSRAGIDTDWILGKGWCLFGNVAFSMLFGSFEIDQNLSIPGANANGFDLKYDFFQNVPNFEIILGIGWGRYFDKNKYHICLRAAYEFHEWWDQLNMRRFWDGGPNYDNDVVSRGNLTLNGFSLRLQIDI